MILKHYQGKNYAKNYNPYLEAIMMKLSYADVKLMAK
jgi:hypothetical protein